MIRWHARIVALATATNAGDKLTRPTTAAEN
jgi:hypothetical protein